MTETIRRQARSCDALRSRTSLPLAYILWFFLGLFGAHRRRSGGQHRLVVAGANLGSWLPDRHRLLVGASTDTQDGRDGIRHRPTSP
jgi:hypothetical protein